MQYINNTDTVGNNILTRFLCSAFGIMFSFMLLSGAVLVDSTTSAADVIDDVSVTVPDVCTMAGNVQTNHTATLMNGTYSGTYNDGSTTPYANGIGSTTLSISCNDANGFSVYVVGFTNDEPGNNTLEGTNTHTTIPTGVYNSSTTTNSVWSMKVTKGTDSGDTTNNPLTIDNGFDDYHTVPGEQEGYTKVAHKPAATSAVDVGATLTTTYDAYISTSQLADTYTGQVKYVMVHPYNQTKPVALPATLDTGQTVNSKLKSLAATVVTGEETTIVPTFTSWRDRETNANDTYIKSINVHLKTPAPNDFTPTSTNTISAANSVKPVYIVFDNTSNAGIMHFYTEGEQIVLPADSSDMFYLFSELANISGINDWDTSNVTNMCEMFERAGYSASTFSLDLSSWDTSSVENMESMFTYAGHSATTWSIGDLSSWDTSSAEDMSFMFMGAGYSANTFSLDLSSWDVSNVTDMYEMFDEAGYSATTWSIGDLSSWDTSSAEDMSYMFEEAGYSASTFSLDLSSWDVSNVEVMEELFMKAGYSASTFSLDLSSWDVSNVMWMYGMFEEAGYSASTFSLDLSSWDTSSVENMDLMFKEAGHSATTWSVTIPQTNGNNISNTTSRIYGQTTSVYGEPLSGKSFTLAQP